MTNQKDSQFSWLGGTRLFRQNLLCVEEESGGMEGAPRSQFNFSVNYKVPDKISSSLKSKWIQFKCECVVVSGEDRAGGEKPLSSLQIEIRLCCVFITSETFI